MKYDGPVWHVDFDGDQPSMIVLANDLFEVLDVLASEFPGEKFTGLRVRNIYVNHTVRRVVSVVK